MQRSDNRMKPFFSNCGDVSLRGRPWFIAQEYDRLAENALAANNKTLHQSYLQHAEHWHRTKDHDNSEN